MKKARSKKQTQQVRIGNPGDSVAQSKFCACFGYLNFNQCFKDCFMECNWFSLCCNCNRCLAGTCQCCEVIGLKGALPKGMQGGCDKKSPICIMFFNGCPIMLVSLIAMILAWLEMTEFGEKYNEAVAAGEEYSCFKIQVPQKTYEILGEDPAEMYKTAFNVNYWVHVVLVVGCFFSILSGPVVVLRWVALPYQMIIGFVPHAVAVLLVYVAATSEATDACIQNSELDSALSENKMLEHAIYIKEKVNLQWVYALGYTVLVVLGCFQRRQRDNVFLKKEHENR